MAEKVKKKVLWIEDQQEIIYGFKNTLKYDLENIDSSLEIELIVARHIKAARELLITNKEQYDALIVDLMLPENEEKLKSLEKLEKEKEKVSDSLINRTDFDSDELDEQTIRLQKEIEKIDMEIEKNLKMTGGYDILNELAVATDTNRAGDKPQPLQIPVIFWTARALPHIKELCRNIVPLGRFKWFQKPEDELIILSTLIKLLKTGV